MKGKRRAPSGNQNARTHGFYSKVLDETEKVAFEQAISVEGIDNEIALLRVKLKSVLEKDPENVKLIIEATNTLAGLLKASQTMTAKQKNSVRENISNVLKDIALPLGFNKNQITIGFKKQ